MFLPGFLILDADIGPKDSTSYGPGTGSSGQSLWDPITETEYYYFTPDADGVDSEGWYYYDENGLQFYGPNPGEGWTTP